MLLFDVSTLGTATNRITFTDDSLDPYFRLTSVDVLNRDITANDIKLPEGLGVADFQTLMGKANMVLGGIMYPNDETSYDNGIKALRKVASLSIEQDDAGSDGGYVPWAFTEYDGIDKQINLKVLYVDLPKRTRNGLKQPFRLFCKVKYPVIQAQTAVTTTIGDPTATTSGSSNLSFTLPHALGLTSYSSNGSLTNSGDMDIYPTITITGPITTPRITNSTTGEYMEFTAVTLASTSDTLIITYDQDSTSMSQAGVTKMSSLTSTSTLFKLQPGINTLALTGATVGSGTTAAVSAFPAWPLA